MAAIVTSEKRTRTIVFQYMCAIFHGVKPMISPEITAATRMPEPVAVNQFKEYTAASPVGLRTTGGTRCIIWCNPTTGNLGAEILSSAILTVGNPHKKTSTLKTSHGTQALTTVAVLWPWVPRASRAPSCSKPQIRLGCHFIKKRINAAIETTAATTSTSQGPWKFDTKHCGVAKNTP